MFIIIYMDLTKRLNIIKLNELNNLLQLAGNANFINVEEKSKELEKLKSEILANLTEYTTRYSEKIKDLDGHNEDIESITEALQEGGAELDITIEYDFINEQIMKLNKLNDKFLSKKDMKLVNDLEYSDDIFSDLDDLDASDKFDPSMMSNLPDLNKNSRTNNQNLNNMQNDNISDNQNSQNSQNIQNSQNFTQQKMPTNQKSSDLDFVDLIKVEGERNRAISKSKNLIEENESLKKRIDQLNSASKLKPEDKDKMLNDYIINYSNLANLVEKQQNVLKQFVNYTKLN